MDKLGEYSDDEEEIAAIKAGSADGVAKETQIVEAQDTNEEMIQRQHIREEEAGPSIRKGNGRGHTLLQAPNESSNSRLFGPPSKILHPKKSEQAESGSNKHNTLLFESQESDPEWGLGVEKLSENVDEALLQKLSHFHTLKKEQGTHFNQSLNRNRSFHNPHIYSKLVQWVEVEETGSGYADMIKGGKAMADRIWPSSTEARQILLSQGGKDVISSLQRKRQEESDERKKKARRDHLDFVGSSTSHSETLALAESRARKVRDSLVTKREYSDRERHRRKDEGERDKDRDRSYHQHNHHHHHSRRP